MSEMTLVKQIQAAFEHEPRINLHRYPVRVQLGDDVVILEGAVENIAAKKIALELAAGMPGVLGVVDRLRITPSSKMTDAEIRDHLRDALACLSPENQNDFGARLALDGETLVLAVGSHFEDEPTKLRNRMR
jgi:hypothetical protein